VRGNPATDLVVSPFGVRSIRYSGIVSEPLSWRTTCSRNTEYTMQACYDSPVLNIPILHFTFASVGLSTRFVSASPSIGFGLASHSASRLASPLSRICCSSTCSAFHSCSRGSQIRLTRETRKASKAVSADWSSEAEDRCEEEERVRRIGRRPATSAASHETRGSATLEINRGIWSLLWSSAILTSSDFLIELSKYISS